MVEELDVIDLEEDFRYFFTRSLNKYWEITTEKFRVKLSKLLLTGWERSELYWLLYFDFNFEDNDLLKLKAFKHIVVIK